MRGQSAAFLKKLRRKFGLGEFQRKSRSQVLVPTCVPKKRSPGGSSYRCQRVSRAGTTFGSNANPWIQGPPVTIADTGTSSIRTPPARQPREGRENPRISSSTG